MATGNKSEAPEQGTKESSTEKRLSNLEAQLRKTIKSLEKVFGVDIDKDGKVGAIRTRFAVFLASASITATALWAVGAENLLVRWQAQEGNDAVLQLEADDGDDDADSLELIMTASGSAKLDVGGNTLQTWTPTPTNQVVYTATGVSASTTYGPINTTVLTIADLTLVIDGSSGAGWGGTNVATIGQGYIHVLGFKVDDLALTTNSVDLADGEGGDFAFGTTKTADNSLATTEINLLASTSLDPIQTAVDAVQVVDIVPLDGTASGTPIYINMLADDGDVAASSTNLVNGTVTITWIYMGDN